MLMSVSVCVCVCVCQASSVVATTSGNTCAALLALMSNYCRGPLNQCLVCDNIYCVLQSVHFPVRRYSTYVQVLPCAVE